MHPGELRQAHLRSLPLATQAVAAVRAEQLNLPTPCGEWSLRQLLEHMAGQNRGLARAALGGIDRHSWEPLPLGPDPQAVWTRSVDELVTALQDLPAGGTLLMPEVHPEPLPADLAISFHFIDTLVHGWDVATAIGRPFACPDDLAELLLAGAARVPSEPERRQPGSAFGPPVDHVSWEEPLDRALARLGRDPAQAPARPPTAAAGVDETT